MELQTLCRSLRASLLQVLCAAAVILAFCTLTRVAGGQVATPRPVVPTANDDVVAIAAKSVDDSRAKRAETQPASRPEGINVPWAPGKPQDDDERIHEAYVAAEVAWYSYGTEANNYRLEAYRQQARYSMPIFFVVCALVGAGIYFAYSQLQAGLTSATKVAEAAVTGAVVKQEGGTKPDTGAPATLAVPATAATPATPMTAVTPTIPAIATTPATPAIPGAATTAATPTATATRMTNEQFELSLSKTTGLVVKTSVIGLAVLAISCAFFFLYLRFVYQIVALP